MCGEAELFIDAVWRNAGGGPHLVLPDGCIDLIFAWRAGADGRVEQPRLFASALLARAETVAADASARFVGVRFRPGMARAVLDIAPSALRQGDIPADAIHPGFASLAERLAIADEAAMPALLRAEARRRLADALPPPPRQMAAIAGLRRGMAPGRLAMALGIADRTLHRDVLAWTGLPPRRLARILRLHRALGRIRAGAEMAEAALAAGYCDQPHMARDFSDLVGHPPGAFRPRVRNIQDPATRAQ